MTCENSHPLRDPLLMDVDLCTQGGEHIVRASAAFLAVVSPSYFWPRLRAHRAGGFCTSKSIAIGTEDMDAQILRDMVVWSTQRTDAEQERELPGCLADVIVTPEEWRGLLRHLDAAQYLQLGGARRALRLRRLHPKSEGIALFNMHQGFATQFC